MHVDEQRAKAFAEDAEELDYVNEAKWTEYGIAWVIVDRGHSDAGLYEMADEYGFTISKTEGRDLDSSVPRVAIRFKPL